jgi:hypothetical protein
MDPERHPSGANMPNENLPINEPRVFRIFVSYASEDAAIASAIANCFKTALPDFFAEVNFDKEFLEPGSPFKAQIESKLQQTDVLIIVYTGAEKRSHGYTGWEVGYFDHVIRMDPGGREKISLYLYGPPAITASEQGIPIGLSKDQLQWSFEKFEKDLSVSEEEPLCKKIEVWQKQVETNIEKTFPKVHRKPEQEAKKCVRNLKLAIFQYLKGTVDTVVKPQRQITIRLKGSSVEPSSQSLPLESEIRPLVGTVNNGGSMNIFGLSDESITWKTFLDLTANKPFADSWRDAITSVVLSGFPDRVDVDNSQVIIANDGRTAYRVILTTVTKFFDDYREYNVYFVEMLERADYGDEGTTDLLKGLELVCRFRSAFLEPKSPFLGENVALTDFHHLPDVAVDLLRELNLLHRDAQAAGLDRPAMWKEYVDFNHIRAIADSYRPCDSKLREIIPKVMGGKGNRGLLESLGKELAEVLTVMETAVRPENALLLREMAAKLNAIVDHQDRAKAVGTSPS